MIPDEIKAIRLSLRLTQREFATRLKVESITVLRWERGYTKPCKKMVKRIARQAERSNNHVRETTQENNLGTGK